MKTKKKLASQASMWSPGNTIARATDASHGGRVNLALWLAPNQNYVFLDYALTQLTALFHVGMLQFIEYCQYKICKLYEAPNQILDNLIDIIID